MSRVAIAALLLFSTASARAETPSDTVPQALAGVGIDEHLGDTVPRELDFVDATGRNVRLADLLDGKRPVVLSLVYFQCPMLCSLVLHGLVATVQKTSLHLGGDYRLVTVSIDPRDSAADAAERQRNYLQSFVHADNGDWVFLVGREREVRALADAVGFRYRWDEASRTYAHSAALFVLSPDGKISRYLYGVEFPERDLRLALVEASQGRVGTTVDRVLLQCFRYDPASRRYALFISTWFRVGGLLVFLALAGLTLRLWRRDLARTREGLDAIAKAKV